MHDQRSRRILAIVTSKMLLEHAMVHERSALRFNLPQIDVACMTLTTVTFYIPSFYMSCSAAASTQSILLDYSKGLGRGIDILTVSFDI